MRFLMFLWPTLICLCFMVERKVAGQCNGEQRSLLLKLRDELSISDESTNPDNFSWAKCDSVTGYVIRIDLSNKQINKTEISTLFQFRDLQSLNLSFNLFNMPFPTQFDRLSNLTKLNLSNSGFTGNIPEQISKLKTLVSLDVSAIGFIPPITLNDSQRFLQSLNGLKSLDLSGVSANLDASIFQEFANLSYLRLSSCQLYGEFPKSIFELKELTLLDASNNPNLTGTFPEFKEGSSLESLVLSLTKFSGNLPESIGKWKNLRRLDLQSCNFSGSIPSSMSNLTNLVYLDLSSNHFDGKFPSLQNLKELVHVDLSSNHFNGSIEWPDTGLQKLVTFNAENNYLEGKIPSSIFSSSLKSLRLKGNRFNVELERLSSISAPHLNTIDLSDNKLGGQFPEWIFDFTALNVITLSSNNFTGGNLQLDRITKLKNLTSLDLSDSGLKIISQNNNSILSSFPLLSTMKLSRCQLTEFPDFLRNQSKLINLDLSFNNISGEIPNWIWKLESLKQLNLSFNLFQSLQSTKPNSTNKFTMLDLNSNNLTGEMPVFPLSATVIDYSNNNFSSVSIPINISPGSSFTIFLSLARNNLKGPLPSSICNMTFLQVIDFSHNNFSGNIPSCLMENLKNLNVLNLRGNKLTGSMPSIRTNCNLRTLNLNGNELEGTIPDLLENCKDLEVLDLGNNKLNGSFPKSLEILNQLRVLVLRSNSFGGRIDAEHSTSFPMLRILDISSNKFSGDLPWQYVRNLTALTGTNSDPGTVLQFSYMQFSPLYYRDVVMVTIKGFDTKLSKILSVFSSLDLSNNHFEGNIPPEIGLLKSLRLLNLSYNSITGQIPPSIGNLTVLESLDLSHNQISGPIPQQLASLTFLSSLDLSNNRLTGRIPQGSQFSTFNNNSFLNNSGLCGIPLTQCISNGSNSTYHTVSNPKIADWHFIVIGIGFGGGMGLVAAPLTFWRKGRKWFNMLVDKILFIIFPSFFLFQDSVEDPQTEVEKFQSVSELSTVNKNKEIHRHFCVFCTEIDSRTNKIICAEHCVHLPTLDDQNNSKHSLYYSVSGSHDSQDVLYDALSYLHNPEKTLKLVD